MSKSPSFLGIDVGAGTARAGVFILRGKLIRAANFAIRMLKPLSDHLGQSADDIRRACSKVVRAAVKTADIEPSAIVGVDFDTTCFL